MKIFKNINICLISNSAGKTGGAEKTLPILAYNLQKIGLNVLVLIPSYGDMMNELKKLNINYRVVPYRMWMHTNRPLWKRVAVTLNNIVMLIPILIILYKWKCNMVLSNTITVSVGSFAAKLMNIKHVWYIREFGFEDHGRVFDFGDKLSYWLMNKCSSFYIFNSQAVMEKFKKILLTTNTKVIYEGYITKDQNMNNKIKHNMDFANTKGVHCLMLGTLQEGKGHIDAINAMGILQDKGIIVFLDIVGTGNNLKYREEMKRLIVRQNLEGKVIFHGFIKDPFPFIEKSDIFLMCSKNEAFGIVTIEAMQTGIVVVGSNSGGTKELIINNFNGLLYESGNFVDLAEKIENLINSPDKSKELVKNAKKWVYQNFSLDNYISNMGNFLKDAFTK